jgi:putative DNA primase/helicase
MDQIYFSSPEKGAEADLHTQETVKTAANTEQEFKLSCFSTFSDTVPEATQLSWPEYCKRFSRHLEKPNKKAAPLWSPASYPEGKLRKAEHVQFVSMGVLDIDGGAAPAEILARLKGWKFLAHSTHSHSAESPSFRVAIPFSKPVPAGQWSEIWSRLNDLVLEKNDQSTKDASRMYFVPSCAPGSKEKFVQVGEGVFLDPDTLPALPKTKIVPIQLVAHGNGASDGTDTEFQAVLSHCKFMEWSSAPLKQPIVSEPLWHAMISNACRFEADEWIHEASRHDPRYDERETNKKIESAFKGSGPITCKRIQEEGFQGCPSGGCKLPGGRATAAPAGLGVWAKARVELPTLLKTHEDDSSLRGNVEAFVMGEFSDNLLFVNGEFVAYHDGYWPRLHTISEVQKPIANFLEKKANPKTIGAYVSLMETLYSEKEFRTQGRCHLLCLTNGTLDPLLGELLSHSPDHRLRTKLDIAWNTSAICPKWERYLGQIFEGDTDRLEKVNFLQEWFGYCLIPDSSQHKFLWLVGAGRNGKSVLLEILSTLVGQENVSNAQLQLLERASVRAELEGKLLLSTSEMTSEATLEGSYLKQIVAGDMIEAERKYQPSFSFRPYCRIVSSTNELPRLLDLSDVFFRRAIFLTFNRQFSEIEQDKSLGEKLKTELDGILVWAVEGLIRLKARGYFEIPASSTQAVKQYRTDSDPVRQFGLECLQIDEEGKGVRPGAVFEAFRNWCQENGHKQMASNTFGKRLKGAGYAQKKSGEVFWKVKLVSQGAMYSALPASTFKPRFVV